MWIAFSIKVLALVSISLSSVLLCSVGSFGEQDNDIPIVTVRFDQREQHVQVFFDKNGTANYTGEVIAEIPICQHLQYVIADLSFHVDKGWPVNGTSRVLFPNGITSHEFYCLLRVPKRSLMNDTGVLTVRVEWRTEPEWSSGNATDTAAIYVERFSKLTVFTEERSQTVGKDEIALFHISVRKDGNFKEYIRIDLGGKDTVKIEHDFPKHCHLEEGESINFTVKARCSEEGAKDIFVIVYSKYGYDSSWTNNTLQMEVKFDLFDRIGDTIQWIKEVPTPLIATLSFLFAAGLGGLVIIGLRTKGFSKQYP